MLLSPLIRFLASSQSRRTVLKGLAGLALGGLLAISGSTWLRDQLHVGAASAAPPPEHPKQCRAEGKKSKDAAHCCSQATYGGICCGVQNGSCATSGCCGGGQFCHNGTCVACLPEGAPSFAASGCCSQAMYGEVCCGEKNGSCAASNCCGGGQFCYFGTCEDCLPEGAVLENLEQAGFCCSGQASGTDSGEIVCCGEANGACAASDCCAGGQVCHQAFCEDCLPEGAGIAAPEETASCCSGSAKGTDESGTGDFVCCGEPLGSCATSECCAVNHICFNGSCVDCLPEGSAIQHFEETVFCCSGAASGDPGEIVCCGEANGSCDTSDCCAHGQLCYQGTCVDCLPAGAETDSPTECCDGSWAGGVCCPGDGTCSTDACCAASETCCNGRCEPACPTGSTRNPTTCLCENDTDVCTGADNTFDPACVNDDGTFTRRCCKGVCCASGDFCRDGVCVGDVCTNPDATLVVCPSQTRCICRPPNSPTPNPDGCVCCPRCPPGSGLAVSVDCRGGCGDCCTGCSLGVCVGG